jgi:hypothetical protein
MTQYGLPVALDSNLLLLLVVGLTSREYIAKHKRLKAFSVSDFLLLQRLLGAHATLAHMPNIVITPNTLTEASNLLDHISDPIKTELFVTLKNLVDDIDEDYLTSRDGAKHPDYLSLGLTDAILLELGLRPCLLLTTDWDLCGAAKKRGVLAENWNHIREAHGIV